MRQSSLHGALDDRAVRQRIAEWHAEFDHIRARVNRRKRNVARGVNGWVAGRQINHQARLVIETNRH